ncbi:putative glycoside hydrolase [Longimicrobium sp.]|uniref:putative glycoside hydrolase n=1 Tax=Longimicrobium sp. TaxID=2029185 RepID=UPI002C97AE01|nr:putative glycoside hydrolase [Longimicrobium sp.]HSU16959.1 putative glycoside hydrolase [Longimicrobium sp.]
MFGIGGTARLAGALVLAAVAAACGASDGQPARGDKASAVRAGGDSATESAARRDSAAAPRAGGLRMTRPDSLRALYVNGWAAGSRSRMRGLIAIADTTEINAFVVDVKESDTYLTYDSTDIALAKEIGADTRPASKWMPALLDTLRAHGIYPIARIVVFKDRMLAEKKPELAIRTTGGAVWMDEKGKPWVNPYDRRVWDYNVAIAREALEMGFQEVQWDYVRFPDVTDAVRARMAFPGSGGKSRQDNIRDFIVYSRQQLAAYHAPVSADIFGVMTNVEDDMGIGQLWENVVQAADNVHPMVYPSHYYAGYYGFSLPDAHPYEVVRIALEDGVQRERQVSRQGRRTAQITPWLQAFTADYLHDGVTYTAGSLRNEIQATYDAGLKGWILWNPGSNFQPYVAALRPQRGGPSAIERGGWRATRWQVPHDRLSRAILRREAPARAPRPAPAAPASATSAKP